MEEARRKKDLEEKQALEEQAKKRVENAKRLRANLKRSTGR